MSVLPSGTRRRLMKHPFGWIAAGFGAGFSPKAPGTVGSLFALLPWYFLMRDLSRRIVAQFFDRCLGIELGDCTNQNRRSFLGRLGRIRRHVADIISRARRLVLDASGFCAISFFRYFKTLAGKLGRSKIAWWFRCHVG